MINDNIAAIPVSQGPSLEEEVNQHLLKAKRQLEIILSKSICEIANVINNTQKNNNTIFIFGNGGSAATALHMANDFSRVFNLSKIPLKVSCLNANVSTFSALANDFGYENVFTEQLKGVVQKQDVVIGISASGNSPNCVSALSLAKEKGANTISLLGFDGGKMKNLSDYYIHVQENDYYIAESIHLTISHALTYTLKLLNS